MSRIQIGLARAATLVGTIVFTAWVVFQQFVFAVGATTVGDDYNQFVSERLPAWVGWLLQTPWWVPSLCAVGATAFLIWLSWPRPISASVSIDELKSSRLAPSQSASLTPTPPATEPSPTPARYLDAALITEGFDKTFPQYKARFARSGSRALFAVEYSVYMSGMSDGGWRPSRKLNAFYLESFLRGQDVKFDLVHPGMTDRGMMWFFGRNAGGDDRFKQCVVGGGLHIRGRVTLHVGESVEEHCYFIMSTIEGPHEMPKVTGEHMFEHMQIWESLPPRHPGTETLYGS